jgi:hypothetical protein
MAELPVPERLPSTDQPLVLDGEFMVRDSFDPEALDSLESLAPATEDEVDGSDCCAADNCDLCGYKLLDGFWGYRRDCRGLSWIVGDGDQFGMFSLHSNHYVSSGIESGLGVGLQFHFLAGPERTDLPPRVFDFSIGYQRRQQIGLLTYDIAFAVDAASDFEGSARKGIRFPAHAVGYLPVTNHLQLVFGADFLDRGDIKLLPVGGLLWRPDPALRIELVFPSPRVDWQLTAERRLYLRGGLGGGSWAVERDTFVDDLVSYRELQLGIGLEYCPVDGNTSALEITCLFDRKLEFTSGNGDYHPNSTVMLRSVTTY